MTTYPSRPKRVVNKPGIVAMGKPEIARRYSVMPMRAIQDDSLTPNALRVLGALCIHANGKGIAWPSNTTIARHVSVCVDTVSKSLGRLKRAGYIRKLSYRAYPRHIKRRGPGLTNRWQILYDGPKTALPAREDIYAPMPQLKLETDHVKVEPLDDNSQGVRGIETKSLAQAFCSGVAAVSGQHRILEQQLEGADALTKLGVTAVQVRQAAESLSRRRLAEGRQPPLRINQLAVNPDEW
tara:strand:+ start:1079 stop:1795 length:717 start_codon:yes stop_codon:yes gene_type:complete